MQNNSEVKVSKRILAYLLDVMLVFLLASLIAGIHFLNPSYKKYEAAYEEYTKLVENFTDKEIDATEALTLLNESYYNLFKYSVSSNIIVVIILIMYFVVFQKFCYGQTLGKKIMKIKVVTTDDKEPSILSLLLRYLPVYFVYVGSIVPLLINSGLVFLLDSKVFTIVSVVINYLFLFIFIINGVTALVRQDKRGLHDIIANTKVINE